MARDTTRARLGATYTNGCFCERPALPTGPVIPFRPRFMFARAAREYADMMGLSDFTMARNGDKVAFGILRSECSHRADQHVRIDWKLAY